MSQSVSSNQYTCKVPLTSAVVAELARPAQYGKEHGNPELVYSYVKLVNMIAGVRSC